MSSPFGPSKMAFRYTVDNPPEALKGQLLTVKVPLPLLVGLPSVPWFKVLSKKNKWLNV